MNRRTAGRDEAIEQSPARERGDGERLHHVRRHRVARKRRAVDDEDAVSLPAQQHRGRRTAHRAPTTIASYVCGISECMPRFRRCMREGFCSLWRGSALAEAAAKALRH